MKFEKLLRRLGAFSLAVMISVSSNPMLQLAAQEQETELNQETDDDGMIHATEVWINPLYEDRIQPEDLPVGQDMPTVYTDRAQNYETDLSTVAETVREGMKDRMEQITVYVQVPEYYKGLSYDVMDLALKHTGEGKEGDYLRWQFGSWRADISYSNSSGSCNATIKYYIAYYTNAEQEAEVDALLAELETELAFNEEYYMESVESLYKYLCDNVKYDYAAAEDSSDDLAFTAYGALVEKEAVCQGYAVLLYRLLLDADVDVRVISGKSNGQGHAWNIVLMDDGMYYNADSTWDAGCETWSYFLKGSDHFENHARDDSYNTVDFQKAYPVLTENYYLTEINFDGGRIEWNEDFSKAWGIFTSSEDQSIEYRKEAVITVNCEEGMGPTCTEAGWELLEAEAKFRGVNLTDSHKVQVPAAGHDYQSDVEWSEDLKSAKAVFTCTHGDLEAITVDADVAYDEENSTEPDCVNRGIDVYTATAELTDEQGNVLAAAHSSREVMIPALGHDYKGTMIWAEDNRSAQGEFVCSRNESHQATVDAVVTIDPERSVPATCQNEGADFMIAVAELKTEDGTVLARIQDGRSAVAPVIPHDTDKGICKNCGEYYNPFSDVPKSAWFHDTALVANERKLMTGTTPTTFEPYTNLTRGQVATILYRMAGEPEVEYTNRFDDVQDGLYFSKPVIWVVEAGIADGYDPETQGGKNNFGPSDMITRQQLAKMLYNYADYCGQDTSASADLKELFPADYQDVASWAQKPLEWMVAENMIEGMNHEDGVKRLNPKGNASRAQMSKLTVLIDDYTTETHVE